MDGRSRTVSFPAASPSGVLLAGAVLCNNKLTLCGLFVADQGHQSDRLLRPLLVVCFLHGPGPRLGPSWTPQPASAVCNHGSHQPAARKAGDAVLTSTLHRAVHGVLCLAHTHRCRSRGDTPGDLAWHGGSRLTLHHAAARGCVGSGTVHKRPSFMRLFVTADRVRPRAASSTSPASARSWLPAFDVDVEMRAWKNVMDINQSVPMGWSLHRKQPSRVVVPAVE